MEFCFTCKIPFKESPHEQIRRLPLAAIKIKRQLAKKNTCVWILNSSGFYVFSRNWIKVPQKSDELQTVHFYQQWTVLSTILQNFQLAYDAVNPGWTVIFHFDFAFGYIHYGNPHASQPHTRASAIQVAEALKYLDIKGCFKKASQSYS